LAGRGGKGKFGEKRRLTREECGKKKLDHSSEPFNLPLKGGESKLVGGSRGEGGHCKGSSLQLLPAPWYKGERSRYQEEKSQQGPSTPKGDGRRAVKKCLKKKAIKGEVANMRGR